MSGFLKSIFDMALLNLEKRLFRARHFFHFCLVSVSQKRAAAYRRYAQAVEKGHRWWPFSGIIEMGDRSANEGKRTAASNRDAVHGYAGAGESSAAEDRQGS